ncbi:hypothetical protein [Burkholderia pseudomultivorans]|uniref:hypothetical protein n=1 Tax=Burkholderia pseudomultivorans TaxID=1207504 RepID=UPI0012D91FF0|nr:hypothetical protein [Burkholderia pseudomultivorans]
MANFLVILIFTGFVAISYSLINVDKCRILMIFNHQVAGSNPAAGTISLSEGNPRESETRDSFNASRVFLRPKRSASCGGAVMGLALIRFGLRAGGLLALPVSIGRRIE